jgi:hypothetical protein
MPDKGWDRPFDDPISLPDGSEVRTPRSSKVSERPVPQKKPAKHYRIVR